MKWPKQSMKGKVMQILVGRLPIKSMGHLYVLFGIGLFRCSDLCWKVRLSKEQFHRA